MRTETRENKSRVEEVLARLNEGETRQEIAASYGHKNQKSLDQMMRRRDYVWDDVRGTYVNASERHKYVENPRLYDGAAQTRAERVVEYLSKKNATIKRVAKLLMFADHLEMSAYMKSQGYHWSEEQQNYVSRSERNRPEATGAKVEPATAMPFLATGPRIRLEEFERFVPLLEFLATHRDRLEGILRGIEETEQTQVPYYAVQGARIPSSYYMVNGLHQLVRDFCHERNLTVRQAAEAAFIEYLRKYGYAEQVKILLDI